MEQLAIDPVGWNRIYLLKKHTFLVKRFPTPISPGHLNHFSPQGRKGHQARQQPQLWVSPGSWSRTFGTQPLHGMGTQGNFVENLMENLQGVDLMLTTALCPPKVMGLWTNLTPHPSGWRMIVPLISGLSVICIYSAAPIVQIISN